MLLRAQLLMLFSVFSANVFACSFMQMLEDFEVIDGVGSSPGAPDFIVNSIHRGSDDGDFSSCSDAGIINLKLSSIQKEETGYIFKIVSGEFEDQLFPEVPVKPTEHYAKNGLFLFLWLDGSSLEQEPIDIVVKIEAISKTGEKSNPQLLKITHAGIKEPWWKLW